MAETYHQPDRRPLNDLTDVGLLSDVPYALQDQLRLEQAALETERLTETLRRNRKVRDRTPPLVRESPRGTFVPHIS